MASLSQLLHGNRIHKTTEEPGRRNLVPSVSPSPSNVFDPTSAPVMWSSTHFNLHPKHSGTLPDAAEGWQIVELITV